MKTYMLYFKQKWKKICVNSKLSWKMFIAKISFQVFLTLYTKYENKRAIYFDLKYQKIICELFTQVI